jgi:hypothetical protein
MIYVQWHTSIETRLKLFFAHNLCETICNVKGLRIQNYKKKSVLITRNSGTRLKLATNKLATNKAICLKTQKKEIRAKCTFKDF